MKTENKERGVPEGAFMTSSSIVMQEPPALMILARALSVKRRAATSSLGSSKILMSSVTVATTTAVLDLPRNTPVRLVGHLKNFHLRLVGEVLDELAERDGGSVDSRSDESSQDGLAEAAIGPSGEELEELYRQRRRVRETMHYLPSREDVDKDSCFSCPSWTCSKFCLFCTSQFPRHTKSVS